ncbi:DEAD/DEAH box helicase [Klebsiella pneumoniae]
MVTHILQHAPHIIVATPGRLLDQLQKGTVSLDALQTLVMDEAGTMPIWALAMPLMR